MGSCQLHSGNEQRSERGAEVPFFRGSEHDYIHAGSDRIGPFSRQDDPRLFPANDDRRGRDGRMPVFIPANSRTPLNEPLHFLSSAFRRFEILGASSSHEVFSEGIWFHSSERIEYAIFTEG